MPWNPAEYDPEWPFELLGTPFALPTATTALLVIDMQLSSMHYTAESRIGRGHPALVSAWNQRMAGTVVPNTRRLIDAFRARQLKIIYTRNGPLTATGAELTRRLRRVAQGPCCPTPAADIDPRLAPRPEDLVVAKLTSGAFTGTILDHALRNMGITSVVIAGILTDMCVLGTARVAAELGYDSLICEDACATLTARAHTEALLMHARTFGRVATTDDVLSELGATPQNATA